MGVVQETPTPTPHHHFPSWLADQVDVCGFFQRFFSLHPQSWRRSSSLPDSWTANPRLAGKLGGLFGGLEENGTNENSFHQEQVPIIEMNHPLFVKENCISRRPLSTSMIVSGRVIILLKSESTTVSHNSHLRLLAEQKRHGHIDEDLANTSH